MNLFKGDKIRTQFSTMMLYGVLLGSVIPLIVVIIFSLTGLISIIHPELYIGFAIGIVILLSYIGFLYHYSNSSPNWFWLLYSIEVVLIFLFVHFVILFTGGAINSLFNGYYLYIPAVIGYVYGKEKQWRYLIPAILILITSYLFNLVVYEEQLRFFINDRIIKWSMNSSDKHKLFYKWCHVIFYSIQLLVTYKITDKKSSFDRENIE